MSSASPFPATNQKVLLPLLCKPNSGHWNDSNKMVWVLRFQLLNLGPLTAKRLENLWTEQGSESLGRNWFYTWLSQFWPQNSHGLSRPQNPAGPVSSLDWMTVNVKPFPQILLVKIYTHSRPGQDMVPTVTRGSVGKGGGDEAWVPRTRQPGCPIPTRSGLLGYWFHLCASVSSSVKADATYFIPCRVVGECYHSVWPLGTSISCQLLLFLLKTFCFYYSLQK